MLRIHILATTLFLLAACTTVQTQNQTPTAAKALAFLARVDSYRICDFQNAPYFIWDKVCWQFPVRVTQKLKGDYVATGEYLVQAKYISEPERPFPIDSFKSLMKKYVPNQSFPKWRMPGRITVIAVLFDEKQNYLGSIQIDTNYDAFRIHSAEDFYFRFGNGAGSKNVTEIITALCGDKKEDS